MKNLIVANWKCNPTTKEEARDIFKKISGGIEGIKKTEVIICPPFIYLPDLASENSEAKLGGQDCYFEEKGAFTGEISPGMLKDMGCDYVIVGHSERRKHQGETDETVNKKIKAALKGGLKTILCIDSVDQIKEDTDGLSQQDLKNIAVAYEPIWAIGTGKACGVDEAKETAKAMREILGTDTPVLYGGSVSSQNAKGYIEEAEFNGLLVGGASLKPEEFIEIIRGVDSIR